MMKNKYKDRYKSDIGIDLIPVRIIEFHGMSDFYFHEQDWNEMGGYHKFLTEYSISPKDIVKIHKANIKPERFPTSKWEG